MTSSITRQNPIYLDYAATTPVDSRVLEEMLPYFSQHFGNSGSRMHGRGLAAEKAVDDARRRVASLLGVRPAEITFTGGATESNSLALTGVAEAWNHDLDLLVSATEHPSVLETAEYLADRGAHLRILPVRTDGRVDPETLGEILQSLPRIRPAVVSVMHANNETGVLNPVGEIAAVCRRHGALFHCDASQSIGKIPVDVAAVGADLLTLSAHKFYGPKGVGALYIRRGRPRIAIEPRTRGGGQERGLRSGTLNVPGIVGLGAASRVAQQEIASERAEIARLAKLCVACLQERLDGVEVNGSLEHRLPGILNLSFDGVLGERLQHAIVDVAETSTGSACSTGKVGPSPTLLALGLPISRANAAVRFSIGRLTSEDEIHTVMDAIVPAVERMRRGCDVEVGRPVQQTQPQA